MRAQTAPVFPAADLVNAVRPWNLGDLDGMAR
jgi:hypothetical protein